MLLTRVIRAAVACGEYTLETALRLLLVTIPDDRTDPQTATRGEADHSDAEAVIPIRRAAPADASETIQFALDGHAYEIDLSPEGARQLRAAFRPYIEAGRAANDGTARAAGKGRPPRSVPKAFGPESAAIREWAREHGHPVSDRGRIPARVLQAYQAARH